MHVPRPPAPRPPAPLRPLNPFFRRAIRRASVQKRVLSIAAGFTCKQQMYTVLRDGQVRATALVITRLERLADAVGFPRDEIFLDGAR